MIQASPAPAATPGAGHEPPRSGNAAAEPRVLFVQDGSRRRYAVPLTLQRAGLLERMACDWYSAPGSWQARAATLLARLRPALGRRMLGRHCPELPPDRVQANPWITLGRLLGRPSTQNHFRASAAMTRWIARRGWGDANVLMGYVRHLDPALARLAREHGLRTVADQIIAPAAVEIAAVQQQRQRFADYEDPRDDLDLEPYLDYERQTWAALDRITCMSAYVREGLLAQGVPPQRITVLEYPFDASGFTVPDRRGRRVVTVGFVGAVNLRKGAPWFLQVARRLAGATVRFVMVGAVALRPRIVAEHRDCVTFTGALPRPDVLRHLAEFDLLLFPSACEGSAGAVMEAMASGLPVVTSPSAGSVARDGVDGWLVPCDDVEAMTRRVQELIDQPELRRQMGHAAAEHARRYTLERYQQGLTRLLRDTLADPAGGPP